MTDDASIRVPTSLEVTALYDGISRDFVGKVDLSPGDDVTCDWYQIRFLDRGLWDTVVNVMATDPESGAFEGGTGVSDLHVYRCPASVVPPDLQSAASDCAEHEIGATVRATASRAPR